MKQFLRKTLTLLLVATLAFSAVLPAMATAASAIDSAIAGATDPEYLYFQDDFDSYSVGDLSLDKLSPYYQSIIEENCRIVAVEGRGNVMEVNSNGTTVMVLDCKAVHKEVSFDFYYEGSVESYGGLYVKLLMSPEAGNEQYFSINPEFGDNNLIISDTVNGHVLQTFKKHPMSAGNWYSMKSRIANNQLCLKLWPSSEEEPAEWTSVADIRDPVCSDENALFQIEFVDLNAGTPWVVWLDNFMIKTYREVTPDTDVEVTLLSADETMGTVNGGGTYQKGDTVTVTAEATEDYVFLNWTNEKDEIVSVDASYSFTVRNDVTLTANFVQKEDKIMSFMADGMTIPAVIDQEAKTISVTFASDVDLSQVRPYFYFEGSTEGKTPYAVMDLSSGSADLGHGWTVHAKQNSVMMSLYVDGVNGSDENSGLTPAEAFATLEKARDTVRAIGFWGGDVLVNIANGTYVLSETLEFDGRDSAKSGCSVIYRSMSGNAEDVVISGGRELTGWVKSDTVAGAWEIDASDIPYSRDLYVNGKKATIARSAVADSIQPEGWSPIDDPDLRLRSYGYTATGSKADLHTWRNQGDIEFVYEEAWTFCIIPVDSITDTGTGASKVVMDEQAFTLGRNKAGRQIGDPNYIQNAFELLDEEGEWYFDREAKKIYYIPEDGVDPNTLEIVIPTLDQLVTVRGTGEKTVNGLAFKDVTFEYTSFIRPNQMGQVEIQANFVVDPETGTEMLHDNYLKTPGGVTVAYAKGFRVEGCVFQKLSASGLDLEEGVSGSTVVGNTFRDIGASGIQIGGVSVRDAQPFSDVTYVKGELVTDAGADPTRVTEQILIMSNVLDNIGAEYNGSVAIFLGFVRDVTVAHNEISNTPYTAISAGWGWGYWDKGGRPDNSTYHKFDTPSVMERYVIENNRISRVCQRLADGGSIYTLSLMPGSVIRGNVMDDCKIAFGGIYLDEGSGGFVAIEDNIATESVHQAYFYHVVANYGDREKECSGVMWNNYFKTGSTEDPEYKRIWDAAGVLPLGEDRTFSVAVEAESENGSIRVDTDAARVGDAVVIIAAPENGYMLDTLTADGEEVTFFAYGDGMAMIMPAANVTVSATFKTKPAETTPVETTPAETDGEGNQTEAPATQETSAGEAPATEAPAPEAPATEAPAEKKGCKSSAGIPGAIAVALAAAVLTSRKKKED